MTDERDASAGTADSVISGDVRPEFMASVYAFTSAALVVTAVTASFLGHLSRLATAISHHRRLAGFVLFLQVCCAAWLSAGAIDLAPAAGALALAMASVNVGLAITLMAPELARPLFAPLLVVAAAHVLLAGFVGAARRHLEDLGPAVFIAVTGLMLSFLVGVLWWNDYPVFFGMSCVTLVSAVLTAFASAQLSLILAARNPTRGPVATIAAALAFFLGWLLYLWQAFPGYRHPRRD